MKCEFNGCEQTGVLGNPRDGETFWPNHSEVCPRRLVSCSHCSKEVTFDSLEQHEASCNFRPLTCEHCRDVTIRAKDMTKHAKVCDKFPVECKECGVKVARAEMAHHHSDVCLIACANKCNAKITRSAQEEHDDTQCPNVEVSCDFEAVGCKVQVLRRNLGKHLKSDGHQHSMLMLESIEVCLLPFQLSINTTFS